MRHRIYLFTSDGLVQEYAADTSRAAWALAYKVARAAAGLASAMPELCPVRIRVQCDGWLVYTLRADGAVELDDHRMIAKWAQPLAYAAALCCSRLP
jgi:hypothetical protein